MSLLASMVSLGVEKFEVTYPDSPTQIPLSIRNDSAPPSAESSQTDHKPSDDESDTDPPANQDDKMFDDMPGFGVVIAMGGLISALVAYRRTRCDD